MRILFLGNNWVGGQVARWLREEHENIVGVVVHPDHKQKHREDIIRSAGVQPDAIFDGARLQEPRILSAIERLNPDIAISVFFGYILRPPFLSLPAKGCINLHPSLLPFNRGAHPNVWSIIEGTPAGVSIHYIDAGVDTGDLIAQRQVDIEPTDTAYTLYHRLERACVDLFAEVWPLIRGGKAPRMKQRNIAGTCHRARDLEQIEEIDLEANYKAKELIDLIRARTFPPHPGVYFRSAGRKVYLRLQLTYEDEARGV